MVSCSHFFRCGVNYAHSAVEKQGKIGVLNEKLTSYVVIQKRTPIIYKLFLRNDFHFLIKTNFILYRTVKCIKIFIKYLHIETKIIYHSL